jgi:CspA family cold shock protein
MGIVVKIVIALLVAAAATAAVRLLPGTDRILPLYLLFAAATIASALLASLPNMATRASRGDSPSADTREPARTGKSADQGRELGAVKWFNANKGFGFIVRENGEEIFVHYRNIRGEGRRSLRDGERVSFRIAETDKGPQAEDVTGAGN